MKEPSDELNELLAPLREVEPTAAMRAANRRAALEPEKAMPWWRRSISVPVPVALATAAALLLAVTLALRPDDRVMRADPSTTGSSVAVAVSRQRPTTPVGSWSVQHSYLGHLQSGAPDLVHTSPLIRGSS